METNTLFPLFLKTEKTRFLIVGGGNVGLEKAQTLWKQNPDVHLKIVAKEVKPALKDFVQNYNNSTLEIKSFENADLDDVAILILATDDSLLNQSIKKTANEKGILVNAADQPDLCDFYLGSIITKGDLKVAISTNGKSPVLARRFREFLEKEIPDNISETIKNLNEFRKNHTGNLKEKLNSLNEITSLLKQK